VAQDLATQLERLKALDERAVDELEAAWRSLLAIIERQVNECADTDALPEPRDLTGLRSLRAAGFERGLARPLEALGMEGLVARALGTSEARDRSVDAWLRAQPESVALTGPEAVAQAETWGSTTPWRWLARWAKKSRPIPLRHVASSQMIRLSEGRAREEGECLAAVGEGLRQLLRRWHAARLPLDAVVDLGVSKNDVARVREAAAAEQGLLERRGARAIARRRAWIADSLLPALVSALVRARFLPPRPPEVEHSIGWKLLPHWRRQLDHVREELDLARALEERTANLLAALDDMLARIAREDAQLRAELDRLSAALSREDVRLADLEVQFEHTKPSDLLAGLDRLVKREVARLPSVATVGVRLRPRPGPSTAGGRTVHPRAAFLARYEKSVRPAFGGLLEAAEAPHRALVEDLRRASDVVSFAASAVEAGETSQVVAREAIENAKSLLEFRRDAPRERVVDGLRAAAAICRAGRDVQVHLYGSWLGRRAHAVRRELERGLPAIVAALAVTAARAVPRAGALVRQVLRRFGSRIGWRRELAAGASHVAVRPTLPAAFASDADRTDVPALYRHLFRPDPLDDERFLVGRAPELAAIAEARDRWEAGHSAGIVVTGERGSGKTSLINCALRGALSSLEVARGEFRDRVLTAEDLRSVIAGIVGTDPKDLESHLGAARRVIVIEEFERTFLRHIGHYEAVRAFWQLISATSASTLWIVVVNDIAFRILDAAVGARQRFSHWIDAGAASEEEVRRAILVRHDLSGLRLRFEYANRSEAPSRRAFGLTRAPDDPERMFFRTVARQSGGVYRTAFNLWLGHIGGTRDGVLTMRVPVIRDLSPVISDLGLSDLFTLIALLQHGSLTSEEHAIVFQQPVEASRGQIEELTARELVSPEPGRPGHRIRPEAMGVVQEALFRRNLI
jgi:hypothetical protein